MPGPTAPKWAQAIGLTTRNQALEYQAYAMGFDSRAQFERARSNLLERSNQTVKGLWRRLLATQVAAENSIRNNDGNASYLISQAQAIKYDLNRQLSEDKRLESPKGRRES